MTYFALTAQELRRRFLRRAIVWAVIGFILGALAMSVVGSAVKGKKAEDPFAGAVLVPVVVASQDIPEGTPVKIDHIEQRNVPKQLVTSSVVKPDAAVAVASAFSFPLALMAAVVAFLVGQGRVDARDPKLRSAPRTPQEMVLSFRNEEEL